MNLWSGKYDKYAPDLIGCWRLVLPDHRCVASVRRVEVVALTNLAVPATPLTPACDRVQVFSRSLNHRWFCLAHLFTDQKFEGGILGLAYVGSPRRNSVGGICSPGTNASFPFWCRVTIPWLTSTIVVLWSC